MPEPPTTWAKSGRAAPAARHDADANFEVIPALAALRWMDRVRVATLHYGGETTRLFVRDRELRVTANALVAVTVALATVLAAPFWTLAITPIVLGVPHLLANLRYMIVRPGFHRRRLLCVVAGVPLAAAALGGGIRAGLIASAAAVVCARTDALKRTLALAIITATWFGVMAVGRFADVVFAHVHNVIAVVFWLVWRRRTTRWHWLPIALMAMCTLAIIAGRFDGIIDWTTGHVGMPASISVADQLARLTPGADGMFGFRCLLVFAFAQSIHYAIWLRLVPDEDRPRATPRSFMASYRSLQQDLGPAVLVIAAIVFGAIGVRAAFGLAAGNNDYFALAQFHGSVEVIAGMLFWLEAPPEPGVCALTR